MTLLNFQENFKRKRKKIFLKVQFRINRVCSLTSQCESCSWRKFNVNMTNYELTTTSNTKHIILPITKEFNISFFSWYLTALDCENQGYKINKMNSRGGEGEDMRDCANKCVRLCLCVHAHNIFIMRVAINWNAQNWNSLNWTYFFSFKSIFWMIWELTFMNFSRWKLISTFNFQLLDCNINFSFISALACLQKRSSLHNIENRFQVTTLDISPVFNVCVVMI